MRAGPLPCATIAICESFDSLGSSLPFRRSSGKLLSPVSVQVDVEVKGVNSTCAARLM